MKLIESSVSIIEQGPGLMGAYKMAEIAGRCAYKSENRMTNDSAKRFVEAMCKSNHGAVLEHGTIYLHFRYNSPINDINYLKLTEIERFYRNNPYSKVVNKTQDHFNHDVYITTNCRVIFENDRNDDLRYLCEPTKHHERRVTARFICSRSVSHEVVRHRKFSFLQESQRYCMYSKERMGGEITYIIPEWVKSLEEYKEGMNAEKKWHKTLQECEHAYMCLVNECNKKAEEARGVLPNDCKTELIMTGFISDWKHFFDLRSKGTTGKPHPDIKVLADDLLSQFTEAKLI